MKVEPFIVDDRVVVYREDEREDRWMETEAMEFDPSDVQVSTDDLQLIEAVTEINPEADAYALLQMIAIY